MKRAIYLIVLLISITAVLAQYCPSPRVVSGERSRELHLNDNEREVWVKFGDNPDSLYRLRRADGMEGVRARDKWSTLQHIFSQIETANELNREEVARMLLEKQCKETRPVNAQSGLCSGQITMSPKWLKKIVFAPEGVYAAALKVISSGTGECTYFAKDVVPKPGKETPKMVVEVEKGPYFDCNHTPPLAFFSRTYTSSYKGRSTQFHVFSYNNWEIHCANIGGNYWELAKKFEYPTEYPSIQPAPTGNIIGRIETLRRLPEGQLKGIIARIDGKSPIRMNFLVKDMQLRQGQKVKFSKSATGLVTSLEVIK